MTSSIGTTNGFVFPDGTSTPANELELYYGDTLKQSGSTILASGSLSITGDTENALFIGKTNKRYTTAPKVTGGLLVQPSIKYYNTCSLTSPPQSSWDSLYYDWVVPPGVTAISAVAVGAGGSGEGDNGKSSGGGGGGGALTYANNIAVTPGETLRIYAGRSPWCISDSSNGQGGFPSGIVRLSNSAVLLKAEGGEGGFANQAGARGGLSTNCIGDVAYSGGYGAKYGSSIGGGGGGAAGYSANGNTGQGGSGYGGTLSNNHGGGGVGLYGEGTSGTSLGDGGSGGESGGVATTTGGAGGSFGGGGGGANDESSSGTDYEGKYGGAGGVRIIWGLNRLFPVTNVDLPSSYAFDGTETNVTI